MESILKKATWNEVSGMTELEAAMARPVDKNVKKITLRLPDNWYEAL